MTDLVTIIKSHLEKNDWNQKEFAVAWYETVANGGSFNTYETKLSKLLNGQPEGLKFLEEPKHLEGLARVLGRSVDEVRDLVAASRAEVALLLDPRLPRDVRAFIDARSPRASRRIRIVPLPEEKDERREREAFREIAERGDGIIVMSDLRHREFFEGAKVSVTSVCANGAAGFRIEALPDLFPPGQPRRTDEDGMPMVSDPDLEARCRDTSALQRDPRQTSLLAPLLARVNEADAAYEPVTFRLDDVVKMRGQAPVAEALAADAIRLANQEESTSVEFKERRYLWMHEGTVLSLRIPSGERIDRNPWGKDAVSPEEGNYRAINKHTEVREVSTFQGMVDAIKAYKAETNPHLDGSTSAPPDLSAQVAAFQAETGINVSIDPNAIQRAIRFPKAFENGPHLRVSPELDRQMKELLDEVLTRPFELQINGLKSCLPLELRAIRDARMVHVHRPDKHHEFLAHLGGGAVRHVHVYQYPCERPTSMRRQSDERPSYYGGAAEVLDGGDVRVEWSRSQVDPLKTVFVDEERAGYDDDD